MRLLITGTSGFIGSYQLPSMVDQSHDIVVIGRSGEVSGHVETVSQSSAVE